MSTVEITLKSGAKVVADVSALTIQRNPVTHALVGLKWTNSGNRYLQYIEVDEVAAAVFVDDEIELTTSNEDSL
jgi:hypothetical protein